MASTRTSARRAKKTVLQVLKNHPVRTAGVAVGAVLGVALLRKAANTAAKVVTIKAVAGAATDIASAVSNGRAAKSPRARGTKSSAVAKVAKVAKRAKKATKA